MLNCRQRISIPPKCNGYTLGEESSWKTCIMQTDGQAPSPHLHRTYIHKIHNRHRKIYSSSHLAYEFVRRATFDTWPNAYIDKDKLAKSGFVYLRNKDLTQCFFCKGVVGFWEKGDDPSKEHRKHFPKCPFIQGMETSNVPLSEDVHQNNEEALYTFLNNYLQHSLQHRKPFVPIMKYQTDGVAITQGNVVYPAYTSLRSRLQSFRDWPGSSEVPPAEKMAEVGFFYAGITDFVVCFCCGGGLFNWVNSDSPFEDHRLYYKFCPLSRSDDICPLTTECESSPSVPCRPKCLTRTEEELLLQHPFCKRLLEMGLSSVTVCKALKEFLEDFSYLPGTLMNCIEVIVDWEEEHRNNNVRKEGKTSENNKPQTDNLSTSCKENSFLPEENIDIAERKLELKEEITKLKEEKELEEQDSMCRKCKERYREVMLLPCNHFHYCRTCTSGSLICLSCGINILGTMYPNMST